MVFGGEKGLRSHASEWAISSGRAQQHSTGRASYYSSQTFVDGSRVTYASKVKLSFWDLHKFSIISDIVIAVLAILVASGIAALFLSFPAASVPTIWGTTGLVSLLIVVGIFIELAGNFGDVKQVSNLMVKACADNGRDNRQQTNARL
ncbi:MAG: hypothetical protein S4CHLAM2_05350 [Chlamydiales bacterium]|nr:hypothetical protein [Chlamydiales bacterium]